MAEFLKKNEKKADFAKGGKTPMFGHGDRTTTATPETAGPQEAGTTAHDPEGDGGKFAKGGSTKMFGYTGSLPAEAGKTSAR